MQEDKANKAQRKRPIFYKEAHEKSSIKHVIAVMSGKGGVGKSLVTSMTALAMQRAGKRAAILDGDITGPSIPHSFGLKGGLEMREGLPYARKSTSGIQIVSTNFMLDKETDPVIWKGPMVAQAISQFWTDIVYEDVDYLFIDMPPGTGDVPLTVFQTLPVDGVILVASPQDLVAMIVEKALNMSRLMGIKILGIVENMSYFKAPDTGNIYHIFGQSHVDETAEAFKIPLLAKLPIDPDLAKLVDDGKIEEADTEKFKNIIDRILKED